MSGFDEKAARAHLGAWLDNCPLGHLLEIRPLRKVDARPPQPQRFVGNIDEALEAVAAAAAVDDDCYLGALPRTHASGKADAVRAFQWLWADLDVGEEGHADAEHGSFEEALSSLDRAPVRPTLLIHSGGGLQAWWALSDEIRGEAWREAMLRMALLVGGDVAVCHPGCILRVAGSVNHKIAGRPRPVRLLDVSGRTMGAEDIAALPLLPAAEVPPAPAPRASRTGGGSGGDRPFDRANDTPVLEVARALGVQLRRMGGKWYGPCPVHGGSHPSMLFGGRSNVATCFSDCGRKAYTAVDLVMGARSLGPRDAVQWLAQTFDFEGFREPQQSGPRDTWAMPEVASNEVEKEEVPSPAPAETPGENDNCDDVGDEGPAGGGGGEPPAEAPPAAAGGDDDPEPGLDDDEIRFRLQSSKQGPRSNLANAALILGESDGWKGLLRYDEFSSKIMVCREPPSHAGIRGLSYPRQWGDQDDALAQLWLQRTWRIDFAERTVASAVVSVAARHRYHPVRDYLLGLRWDGERRAEQWLQKYMGVKDSAYIRAIGAMFLRSAVARILQPGCQVDTMPVLKGEQGFRKSTALKVLFSPAWFTDELADFGSKDASEQLLGVWCVEVGELSAMARSEVERVKAFLSRSKGRFRASYGRHVAEYPRQCVLAGTTNNDNFLHDVTGNRRFWPIEVGATLDRADIDGLRAVRDQLWAEAVADVQAGVRHHLDKQIDKEALEGALRAQEDARERDAWEHLIVAYVDKHTTNFYTTADLLGIVGIEPSKWTLGDQKRVNGIAKGLGWKKDRQGTRETRERGWEVPGKEPPKE